MIWHIGCSGFHYKEWKGSFYPDDLPQRGWFEHYTRQFNTLELNVTFYRFPQVSFLNNWFEKSPSSFLFSVKVPRLITHYKQFNDTRRLISDFYTSIREGLRFKLGAVLFQLPAQAIYSEERLHKIISNMDPSFNNVVEFRHASWWTKKVMQELADNNISFCGISYPGLPDEPVINTPLLYYRYHGTPVLYKSEYPATKLMELAESIRRKRKPKAVYVYFNNTASAAALHNATFLRNLVNKDKEYQLSSPEL
jgi:uncharacterized protein YecE (DUF72 family)